MVGSAKSKRQYVRQNAERITADVVILMRGFVITAFIPVSALAPTITSSSITQFYIQLLSLSATFENIDFTVWTV